MRTKEEILRKDFNITENTMFHEYKYLYDSILKAMSVYSNERSDKEYKRGIEDGKTISEHGSVMYIE